VEAGSFLVDLPDLGGRKRLEKIGIKFHALLEFAGE
jgi:adenine phosphoribosyltransferase